MAKKDEGEGRLGKLALMYAKKGAGAGWDLLGEPLQRALVFKEAAQLVLSQAMEKYDPAKAILQAADDAFYGRA